MTRASPPGCVRRDNGAELMTLLEETFASRPRAHWLALLAEHDIPAAGMQTIHDFMERSGGAPPEHGASATSIPSSGRCP